MHPLTKILFTICFIFVVVFVVALVLYIQTTQNIERLEWSMNHGTIKEKLDALPPEQREDLLNKYPALRHST